MMGVRIHRNWRGGRGGRKKEKPALLSLLTRETTDYSTGPSAWKKPPRGSSLHERILMLLHLDQSFLIWGPAKHCEKCGSNQVAPAAILKQGCLHLNVYTVSIWVWNVLFGAWLCHNCVIFLQGKRGGKKKVWLGVRNLYN